MFPKRIIAGVLVLGALSVPAIAQMTADEHLKKAHEYIAVAEKDWSDHNTAAVLKDLAAAKSEIEAYDQGVKDEKTHAKDLAVEEHIMQVAMALKSGDAEQMGHVGDELKKIDDEIDGITLFLF